MNCPKCGYEGPLEGTKHCPRCLAELSNPDKPMETNVSQKVGRSEGNVIGVQYNTYYSENLVNNQPIELDYKPYLIKTYEDLKEELDLPIPRTLESKVKESKNQIIPVEEVLSNGKPALILGEPGSGKTYLTRYLAKYIIERNSSGEIPKIPVLIKAKMWGSQFDTIPEAISKELEYLVDKINTEIVKSDINANKFIIIIDGYDEIRGEGKNDLTWEIGRIAGSRKAQIILTSREANYHKELTGKFSVWKITGLSNEQIDQYAKQAYSLDFFSYHLGGRNLIELARLPLYLLMLCKITKDHEGHVPNNKAKIQEEFAQLLLEEGCRLRNPGFEPEYSIDQKLKFLSELARRRSEDASFNDYTRCALDAKITENPRILLDEIIESGLLKGEATSVVEFIHPTTAEFFHARSIASLPDSKIIEFIKMIHSKQEYLETILLLVGLLRDQGKQGPILDYLEENNLPLYIKSLSARQHIDLSSSVKYAEIERRYLSQLQRSYNTLLDRYFEIIKKRYSPFVFMKVPPQYSLEDYIVQVRGSLDITNSKLYYEYVPIIKKIDDDEPIVLQHSPGSINYTIQNGDAKPSPVISASDGRTFYKDLNLSNLGLDSAREVAMRDINKQIKQMIEYKALIPPIPLACERVVAWIRKAASTARTFGDKALKPIRKFENGIYNAQEYLEAFESIQNHPFIVFRFQSPGEQPKENHVPIEHFDLIILLLRHFVAKSISIQENILPKFEYPGVSDPVLIKKRIEDTYSILPKLYMELINHNFPNLRQHLWHAKIYPFKYIIHFKYEDPRKTRGVYISDYRLEAFAIPTSSKEDISAEVIQVETDREELWTNEEIDEIHYKYIQNLKAFDRYDGGTEDKFFSTQIHEFVCLLHDEVLNDAVYSLLKRDMEAIIEDW